MAYSPPNRFNTPMFLLIPEVIKINGVLKKSYENIENRILFYGCFRTFGGTDIVENGIYSVKSTATIDTWYNPSVTSDCRVALESGVQYEIIGEPENIEMMNKYLRFKVERLKGKA